MTDFEGGLQGIPQQAAEASAAIAAIQAPAEKAAAAIDDAFAKAGVSMVRSLGRATAELIGHEFLHCLYGQYHL